MTTPTLDRRSFLGAGAAAATNPEKLAEMTALLKKHYRELVDDSHVWPKATK